MTWLFSQALMQDYANSRCSPGPVAASSGDTSSDGEPSAQLNVMPTPHKFWRNDKTMEPCDLSRFGLTCAVLTDDHGEAVLTWCLEASLARTSALPAEVPALKAHAAECGATWRGSLAKYDPASCTWRTAQRSLLGDSEECSVIWPRSGMTAGGQCWELPTLAPPTSATASGLWPTPTSSLGTNGGRVTPAKAREGGTLIEALSARTMWPTPDAHMGSGGRTSKAPPTGKRASGTKQQITLNDAVKWATPTARDWRSGKASQATHDKNSRPLSEQIGGSLNPTWVEWLMGWPIGWTDLKPWATDRCQPAPQQRGECLQEAEA